MLGPGGCIWGEWERKGGHQTRRRRVKARVASLIRSNHFQKATRQMALLTIKCEALCPRQVVAEDAHRTECNARFLSKAQASRSGRSRPSESGSRPKNIDFESKKPSELTTFTRKVAIFSDVENSSGSRV